MDGDLIVRALVILFATVLFVVGVYLYVARATAPATSAMSFVFLLVVVLTISHYKRVKGFGFEAEMWDEKQIQAATLIDRLELLSEAATQQVALIAAKLGLWDSGFSNPELNQLMATARKMLETTETSEAGRQNILAPLYQRVALNYVSAAQRLVELEMRRVQAEYNGERFSAPPGDAAKWNEKLSDTNNALSKLRALDVLQMRDRRSIQPIEDLVAATPWLATDSKLTLQLQDISLDMAYFEANGNLRRSIDWSYLWR